MQKGGEGKAGQEPHPRISLLQNDLQLFQPKGGGLRGQLWRCVGRTQPLVRPSSALAMSVGLR